MVIVDCGPTLSNHLSRERLCTCQEKKRKYVSLLAQKLHSRLVGFTAVVSDSILSDISVCGGRDYLKKKKKKLFILALAA